MRLIVQVLPLLPENSRGTLSHPHLAAFKPRKFALPVEDNHTFEQVWKSIEDRYKRNYLTPAQTSSFMIKKLQDAYDCDLDLGDTVASIFEGESDPEKRMIKVVPGFIDRDFSVPFTSNLRPAYAQKRTREINELNANKRQRIDSNLGHSLIPDVSPDKPLPSTESEGRDDNDGRNEGQPMEENGDDQRRSRSKDSVIYVKGTQLEGADVGQPEIVPKRESPELGVPMMRTIPESEDEESEPRPVPSQDNPPAQEERPFLKPTLPASMMNKRQSQESRTEPPEPEETQSGAMENANSDIVQSQEEMEDISDHSPSLHSSPKSDTVRNASGIPEPKVISARQNVYDVFDSPERDLPKTRTTRRLATYGRFPRTPKLVQTALSRSRSSSAKSASSRTERSVSARKSLFRVQEKDDIVSTPEPNDRSSVRGESPMYASKLLDIVHKRGSQSKQTVTTASPEAAVGDGQEAHATPKVSPAQKPSSLKRPSKTSYQMPKPSTRSNTVNGGRAAGNNSFKTPNQPSTHPHPFKKNRGPDSDGNNSTTTTPLHSNSRKTDSTPGTMDQKGSKTTPTPTSPRVATERRLSSQGLSKTTSSSPQSAMAKKIADLKRSIEQRRSEAPSSQIRQQSVASSVGQAEQPSNAASSVIETSDRDGLNPDEASKETESVTAPEQSPSPASEHDVAFNKTLSATDTQQSPAPLPQSDELSKETSTARKHRSLAASSKRESPKVRVPSKIVPRTENSGAPGLREQLVATSASTALVDAVSSTSERPRSTPLRSAVPLPENVRSLSSQVYIDSVSAHSGKCNKRVASVAHTTARVTPVPAPIEKSTKRRRGGKDESPKPATQVDETKPVEGGDVRATPPAKRRKTSGRVQQASTTSSEAPTVSGKDNGHAITPAMLQTLLGPAKVKKEPKATPSPLAVPHSSEAVIELSSNSSNASSASSDIPFEGNLSLFPTEEEVQSSLQADSQREAGGRKTASSPGLGQEQVDHSSPKGPKKNGKHTKNQEEAVNSVDLGDLPDADGASINGDKAEKIVDETHNGTTPHPEVEDTEDHALAGEDEEDTGPMASLDGNVSIDAMPSGQGENAPVSSVETQSVAPVTEPDSDDEETSRKPARYLSRSPTPRSGSEAPSSSDEPINGVVVNGDNNENDKSTSSSSSDTSSDEESDADKDVEMPNAREPASSPPTYASQAKNRLAKQGMMVSSQPTTSQSLPPIATPTPLPTNVRTRASMAPTTRTRTSTTPATNPNTRTHKSSEPTTKPRRPAYAKFPSLSQQVQEISQPVRASSPAKKFNPTTHSFKQLKGQNKAKVGVNGKNNSKIFPVSDESEDEDEESEEGSSGDEVNGNGKGKGQMALGDRPGCSVV